MRSTTASAGAPRNAILVTLSPSTQDRRCEAKTEASLDTLVPTGEYTENTQTTAFRVRTTTLLLHQQS